MISKQSRILHWIQITAMEVQKETGESWIFKTNEVQKRFKSFPKGTVSSAITRIFKQGIIDRIERGLYRLVSVWYEHFISITLYCGTRHKVKEMWYVITHAPFGGSIDQYNDIHEEMLEALSQQKPDCYNPEEFEQYQNSKQISQPNKKFTYNYVEIGKLDKKFRKTAVWRVKI